MRRGGPRSGLTSTTGTVASSYRRVPSSRVLSGRTVAMVDWVEPFDVGVINIDSVEPFGVIGVPVSTDSVEPFGVNGSVAVDSVEPFGVNGVIVVDSVEPFDVLDASVPVLPPSPGGTITAMGGPRPGYWGPGGFVTRHIMVFDQRGSYLGDITKYHEVAARTFRITETEDWQFIVPYRDEATATDILTPTVYGWLKRDRFVYIEDEEPGFPAWAGPIIDATDAETGLQVHAAGGLSLFQGVETGVQLTQTGGASGGIARALVEIASQKIGIPITFVDEGGNPNWGAYQYEGDILSGLQSLCTSAVGEMYMRPVRNGAQLLWEFHWAAKFSRDLAPVTIRDGVGGHLAPGYQIKTSALELLNHARVRGSQTNIASYTDYGVIRSLIREMVPEATISVDAGDQRYRELLMLSVSFSLSADVQKSIAQTIQTKYIGHYLEFLNAYHNRQGRPWLPGYEWAGPTQTEVRTLQAHFYRSYQKLGAIGGTAIIASSGQPTTTPASTPPGQDPTLDTSSYGGSVTTTSWQVIRELTLAGLNVVGITLDYSDGSGLRYVADSTSGSIYVLQTDLVTTSLLAHVAGSGETLVGVATDPAAPSTIWVLLTTATSGILRSYTLPGHTLIGQWSMPDPTMNDFVVDASGGVVYIATTGSGSIVKRDLTSGTLLASIATGLSALTGLHASGGVGYAVDASGHVKQIALASGTQVGDLNLTHAADGIFADTATNEVWLTTAGTIAIYAGLLAVAVVSAPAPPAVGTPVGAPGFPEVERGQYVHIVMTGDRGKPPTNKLIVIYSPGSWQDTTVKNVGQPDQLSRTWVTGTQVIGISTTSDAPEQTHDIIIEGEEGRLQDWKPETDGYGKIRHLMYKTPSGHAIGPLGGWFPAAWDIPDSEWAYENPGFPEGEAYLSAYLDRHNREQMIQTVKAVNRDGLWNHVDRGATFPFVGTLRGPVGVGIVGTVRITGFSPDENAGYCELRGEWA